MGSRRMALSAILGLALLPLPNVPAGAGCADEYATMALGTFPIETTTLLFYAADDVGTGSFNVRWTGLSCGTHFELTAEYGDVPGSATEGQDYDVPAGSRTPKVCSNVCSTQQQATFTVMPDGEEPAVTEVFTVVLSNPVGGSLDPPSAAPFVLVDAEGATPRLAFDELAYSQSESYETLAVAVWRAGSDGTQVEVPYTAGPGPGNAATLNEDYSVTSPNPLVFGPGDRVELITLSIANDKQSEADETIQIDLQGAVSPSTKVVTIQDNEENVPPGSRLHHPRHKWRYKKSDYRIREVHVFTHDNPGGAGVTGTQLALRRNLKSGDCVWLTKKGWEKEDCQNREWLDTVYDQTGQLWRYRLKQLKSSIGTRIKDYTAFSRAIDGAGNVENDFKKKRNANTFEVKRSRR